MLFSWLAAAVGCVAWIILLVFVWRGVKAIESVASTLEIAACELTERNRR